MQYLFITVGPLLYISRTNSSKSITLCDWWQWRVTHFRTIWIFTWNAIGYIYSIIIIILGTYAKKIIEYTIIRPRLDIYRYVFGLDTRLFVSLTKTYYL